MSQYERSLLHPQQYRGKKQFVKESIAERQRRIQLALSGKSDAKAIAEEVEDVTETDITESVWHELNASSQSEWASISTFDPISPSPNEHKVVEVELPAHIMATPEEATILSDEAITTSIAPSVSPVERRVHHKEILDFAVECEKTFEETVCQKPRAATSLHQVDLPDRRIERTKSLTSAKERVHTQNLERIAQELAKVPEQERRARRSEAFQVYLQYGMPSKATLIAKMEQAANEGESCTASVEDIDLLPWMDGEFVVDMAAMK